MQYSWLTYVAGRQQLAQRLADPSNVFWTDSELGAYLCEALTTWNALTATWKTSFAFSIAAASSPTWYSLGAMAGSPRLRSTTDSAVYMQMQRHLLEPVTGGVWGGTSQFSIADFAFALQRCRDEAIQITNCNQVRLAPIATTPGDRVIALPDTALDISRARWVPLERPAVTLVRNDDTGFNFYQTGYLQADADVPSQYNIASLPPLSLEVDVPPVQPGTYDLIALQAGGALVPPAATLLNVPNDAAWVLKWGAMADLLSRESEATDMPRAKFCRQRYQDGLRLLQATPWVMQADLDGVAADLVAMTDMDNYVPEWDSGLQAFTAVVIGGVDFFTVNPKANDVTGVVLTVLGNAPVPVDDPDFIQCSRDVWESILDYAQFLAAFKQGGTEFSAALALDAGFLAAAKATNGRLQKLGLFADVYAQVGTKEIRSQERFGGSDGGNE